MVNYQNGKIYQITSIRQPDLIYIGSTCMPLQKRLRQHRKDYRLWQEYKRSYRTSFDIVRLQPEVNKITLLEEFPCKNKRELNKREGEWILENKDICVNKYIAGRGSGKEQKEYKRIYEKTSEKIQKYRKEYSKKWYQLNKQKVIQQVNDRRKRIKANALKIE